MLRCCCVLKEYYAERYKVHCFILLSWLFFTSVCHGQETIQSSVSPEFPHGLHAKYLHYVAVKLEANLELIPLTFARRIAELKHGNLDIVVGLRSVYADEARFILLKPSYESLKNIIFVKKAGLQKITTLASFKQSIIAVTIGGTYFSDIDLSSGPELVRVSSLEQKIGLLEKGRVDGFIHFAPSTIKLLNTNKNHHVIVPAAFQTEVPQDYYFGLSKKSKFISRISEIEEIIEQGKLKGDFKAIRIEHYLPKSGQTQPPHQ